MWTRPSSIEWKHFRLFLTGRSDSSGGSETKQAEWQQMKNWIWIFSHLSDRWIQSFVRSAGYRTHFQIERQQDFWDAWLLCKNVHLIYPLISQCTSTRQLPEMRQLNWDWKWKMRLKWCVVIISSWISI